MSWAPELAGARGEALRSEGSSATCRFSLSPENEGLPSCRAARLCTAAPLFPGSYAFSPNKKILGLALAAWHGAPFHQFPERTKLGEREAQGNVVSNSCNTQIFDFHLQPGVPTKDCVLRRISLSTVGEYVVVSGSFQED